jgi:NAD(P)-dependent dehydrogenase (short-subunit alcohol dehydrogenase family)
MPSELFRDKTAFVTGAGRGIGAATARLFAENGARVVLVSRTRAQLDKEAARINQDFGPGRALAIAGDVGSENFVREAFEKSEKAFGPVNILVNNAGAINDRSPLSETSLETWEKIFSTNVTGTFLCCKYAIAQMHPSGGGAIVNVSSLSGIRSALKFPGYCSYIASKHAVVGLTEGLSVEVKQFGIRVNCVAPGAVDTEMLRRAAPELKTQTQPEDIARVIAYLCDDGASKALTGAVIEVNSND